jgi:hypothetical protein
MAQLAARSPGNLPWVIRRWGRSVTAIVSGVGAYLLTMRLPDEVNLLVSSRVGSGIYLAVVRRLTQRAAPEVTAEFAGHHAEPPYTQGAEAGSARYPFSPQKIPLRVRAIMIFLEKPLTQTKRHGTGYNQLIR